MKDFFSWLWDALIRLRVWVVNGGAAFLLLLLPLLGAPEILAVVPDQYDRYLLAAAFIINILLRPRPANRQSDPEVIVAKQMKEVAKTEPVTVVVQGATTGETQITVEKKAN